jgi:hypothetical protein
MPHYFLLLDAPTFHGAIVPALAASWRRRSFAPCAALCESLQPAAVAFAERFRTGADEALVNVVPRGLPFDRHLWRALASELLWYTASDLPTVRTAPDTLCCLLAPERYREGAVPRERFAPIQQAHLGSRDLVFGGGYYRPDDAGYNDAADVRRLADYLAGVDPTAWTVDQLTELPDLDDEGRQDELEYARQRFAELREVYGNAAASGRVVVCEVL